MIYLFVLANSKDPDEMLHDVAFHLGLHCFPNERYHCGVTIIQTVNAGSI